MIGYFFAIALGFGLLVWGADRLVAGASALAGNLGVPPLIIGLAIVGIGTSAPEIMVSGMAAWQGNPHVAIGNAVGSNIANIGLVVGATALVLPLVVDSATVRGEFLGMFAVFFLAAILLFDGTLTRVDGAILMLGFVVLIGKMIHAGLTARATGPMGREFHEAIPILETPRALLWLFVGLVVLLAGSRAVVWGAVGIAQGLGVSDLVIGLTIIAVGTSLPELGASLMAAYRKEPDIAIGNVIGSNMFNLLPVLGLPGLIAPGAVPADVLYRDMPVMLALSVALVMVGYGFFGKPARIRRWEGALLLAAFCGYQGWLYLSA